jgi:chromosome segregation ATPase
MSVSLSEVLTEIRNRKSQKEIDFQQLVEAVVAGDDLDPADVAKQLDLLNKSAADLQAKVLEKSKRLSMQADVARIPELDASRRTVDAEILQARTEFEAAEKAYHEHITPLVQRSDSLAQQLAQACRQREQLRRGYRGPLLAEQQQNETAREGLRQELAGVQEQLVRVNWSLNRPDRAIQPLSREAKRKHEATRNELNQEIARLKAAIGACDQREAEIETAKCLP